MKNTLRYLSAILIIGGLFVFAGCGQQPTQAPSDDGDSGLKGLTWVDNTGINPFADPDGKSNDATTVPPVGPKVDAAIGVVTPLFGGLLDLDFGVGKSDFLVPPGAVNWPTIVSVRGLQITTPWSTVTLYDFGPNGLVFRKPCTLSLDVSEREGTVLSLYWWNPATRKWEKQEECPVTGGKVFFDINHFSKYGIA